jgi:hypothetical protein
MTEKTNITEAQLLLNQEIVVTSHLSRFTGRKGRVNAITADGRSLDVTLEGVGDVFLDVSLVGEIQEQTQFAKTEQSLGPDANSVLPNNRL